MKAFLIFASFLLIVSTVNATVHIVTCQNGSSHFIPDTVNAVVGDTIHWTWLAGVHITGPINASNIPTVQPHGMHPLMPAILILNMW